MPFCCRDADGVMAWVVLLLLPRAEYHFFFFYEKWQL
jgi:hypothetical protein